MSKSGVIGDHRRRGWERDQPRINKRGDSVANNAEPSPDEKASEIINKVPSSSLWSKTGGILLGTGLTAAAVSNELYVGVECRMWKTELPG